MSSSPDASPSDDAPDSVPEREEPPFADMISPLVAPEMLHTILRETFTLGNQVRLRFIAALCALHEIGGAKSLGKPDTEAYVLEYYMMSSTQLYEYLDVGKALKKLPQLAEAFQKGRI